MALAAALVGLAMGSVLTHRRSPIPWQGVLAVGVVMVGLLAIPYPRTTTDLSATIQATPAGEPVAATDRDGLPAVIQDYNVSLDVAPAAAVQGADWFELISWQGGTTHPTALVPDGNGHYHASSPVPTGGTWKTIVYLAKHDVMMATPISMPIDTAFGQTGVRVSEVSGKTVALQSSEKVLVAEQHDAAPTVKAIAYAFFFLMFGTVIFLLGFSYTRVNRRTDMPYGGGPWPEPPNEQQKRRKASLKPARGSV
jgi:hypothetical protein